VPHFTLGRREWIDPQQSGTRMRDLFEQLRSVFVAHCADRRPPFEGKPSPRKRQPCLICQSLGTRRFERSLRRSLVDRSESGESLGLRPSGRRGHARRDDIGIECRER